MSHLARIETSRFPIRFNARGEDETIPVRSDQVSDVSSTSKGSGVTPLSSREEGRKQGKGRAF
jgi:hypothetical protein